MANILVTGSKGQVGQELQFLSRNSDHHFVFADVAEMDITDSDAVNAFFRTHGFEYCINCAAYTAVDKAESETELATKINVTGAQHLAQACLYNNTFLFQLSTDYVYHNQQNTPFKEGDATSPQGVYAQTKLDGDLAAMKINLATMVVRTSWVYSSYGNNFVKTMLRLGKESDHLNVVFDQIGTPTYARDLASAILTIISQIESNNLLKSSCYGVFHYSNEGVSSWYDFAQAIFKATKTDCSVGAIETVDYPTPAKRPPFSVLNKGKIKKTTGIEIPHWEDALTRCLEALGMNL
ncbi:MAG: dTDP-4-dehydrorhamnose reductase [Gammaproteobacteria bacterium]|jgi:dTDP-4-dehydrorhamnose reductase